MAVKKDEKTRVSRDNIEAAWREMHNLCAKVEGLLTIRDVLAISKDAYAEIEALNTDLGEHVQAVEEAAEKRRTAEAKLASVEQRLIEETEQMRNRMVRDLERRNADLLAESVATRRVIEDAKAEHKNLVQRLGGEITRIQEELKQLRVDKKDLEREKVQLVNNLRKIREGIPVSAA